MSPISPEKRCLYPENWARISRLIRERAGWKCELCQAGNTEPHPITGSEVVLTVHHINGDPTDMRKLNMLALCQRCHNKLDQPFRHKRKAPGGLIGASPEDRRTGREIAEIAAMIVQEAGGKE